MDPISSENHAISLIVCAKNEAENLKNNIPLWLAQAYPNFEIILINDASSDDTLEIMEQFAAENDCIQIVNVKNNEAFWGNKKYALTLGIKRAKNKRMLFTDADCKPASNNWLALMAGSFTEEKELVLGYGAYEKAPGLLNSLIRYETLLTAVQYFSYAKVGMPYMGVGRNLAYTSNLYYANNGFMSHIKIPSGDDDLFVNEAATSKNTALCYSENAFTYSLPKKTWKSWFIQKKRHVSTAKLYKPTHKFLLGTYYFLNLLFWIVAAASFVFLDWKIPAILISFRFLVQWITIGKAASKLKENNLIPFLPFLDLFLVFIQMSIFISNSVSKQTKWN
ncbi:glycosyltransferase [Ulvibacter litoralis]|uniref:glycosyltransferase n=1 Tax=Ulvibacter litoralis TaxID=227084 RepID=UPI0019CF2A9A|nr:glycosyltransferase [Ulvibacter litoralis]GHC55849.1 glycosyl transferase family 2 [Ulvibacter litoralis]